MKKTRENHLVDLASRFPKEANRVDCIEDLSPDYFEKIDEKIEAKEKLVSILARRALNNYKSISVIAY